MEGQGREKQAARLTIQANWILTSVALSGFVPLAVFAHDILRLWIGPVFANQATSVLRILTLGIGIACLFAIPNFYLLGTGRARWLAAMSFAQGLITLAVSALLIPVWAWMAQGGGSLWGQRPILSCFFSCGSDSSAVGFRCASIFPRLLPNLQLLVGWHLASSGFGQGWTGASTGRHWFC